MTSDRIVEARKSAIEYLRRLSIEKGISQLEIAKRSGLSQNEVNTVLCNRRGVTLDTYFKIVDALGIELPKPYKEETDYFKIHKDCRYKHNPKDILK